jgi:hypothetical protein
MLPLWPTQPGLVLALPELEQPPVFGAGRLHCPVPDIRQDSSWAPLPEQPGVVADGSKSIQRKLPL